MSKMSELDARAREAAEGMVYACGSLLGAIEFLETVEDDGNENGALLRAAILRQLHEWANVSPGFMNTVHVTNEDGSITAVPIPEGDTNV